MKKRTKRSHTKKKKQANYKLNLYLYSFAFLMFLTLSIYVLTHSIKFENQDIIDYKETGALDYKVHLKPNDYYETDTLNKDMLYVASLIDSIDTTFNYDFKIDENVDMDFTYNILGRLQITDDTGENIYLEKKYDLVENKKLKLDSNNHVSINEKLNIDYNMYNNIASGFKATYALASKSNLIITLQIVKNSDNKDVYVNGSTTVQTMTIPLSEKSVNIKLDYNDISKDSTVITQKDVQLRNTAGILSGIILVLISLHFLLRIIKSVESHKRKLNKYDKFVNKILKEYDRLIVETETLIDFDKYEKKKKKKFEELLDARDNLKSPINYYVKKKKEKSYFYIVSDRVYFYEISGEDLETNKKVR